MTELALDHQTGFNATAQTKDVTEAGVVKLIRLGCLPFCAGFARLGLAWKSGAVPGGVEAVQIVV